MSRRQTSLVVLVIATIAFVTAAGSARSSSSHPAAFTVHEWGTFTSIAGADGRAVEWLPQGGPVDLPCFVERNRYNVKGMISGTVRMETPVLYFYASQPATVNVKVRFPEGVITEWFPHASVTPADWSFVSRNANGSIAWSDVKVLPGFAEDLPRDAQSSHYYAARETDATLLHVGSQVEKYLFYRGVGRFAPPIVATVRTDDSTMVRSPSGQSIGDVIYFENRQGRIGYTMHQGTTGEAVLDAPALDDEAETPRVELATILEAHGLYRKEAEAMVETWRDTWFEEGSRLFYIVPQAAIDAILPLEMTPAPADVVRVFVGRVELATSATRQAIREALAEGDLVTLGKHGRFLQAMAPRAIAEVPPQERAELKQRLQSVENRWVIPQDACR
jgi:hypothetical protein